jgi:hypothetical protein
MGIGIDEYFAMGGDDIFCIKPRIQDAAKVLPGTAEEKERAWAERHEVGPMWPRKRQTLTLM